MIIKKQIIIKNLKKLLLKLKFLFSKIEIKKKYPIINKTINSGIKGPVTNDIGNKNNMYFKLDKYN